MLPKQTWQTYRLRAVSLLLPLSVYDKQWSVSCEYTRPLVLSHQTERSQKIEQSPVAWDVKSERRIINNYQKAQRIVFTKASALSLQMVPFRSSFKTVYVFMEKGVLWISALQVSGKNCNHFELPHSVWTNPVYKTSWASLPAKQYYSWFQFRFNVKLLHDWSNFDLPKLTPVEHISLMPSSCLSARIHANKLLITAQPIRNLRTLVSTEMNKRGFL